MATDSTNMRIEAIPQAPKAVSRLRGDLFTHLAMWQFLIFLLLLLFVWACQVLDFSAALATVWAIPENHVQSYLISIGVVIVGIITVGNSYLQQQHTLRRMLRTCSVCRRVQLDPSIWEHVEEYVARHKIAGVSHEICTTCMSRDILDRGRLKSGRPVDE